MFVTVARAERTLGPPLSGCELNYSQYGPVRENLKRELNFWKFINKFSFLGAISGLRSTLMVPACEVYTHFSFYSLSIFA